MKRLAIVLVLSVGVTLIGCSKTKPEPSGSEPATAPSTQVSQAEGQPTQGAQERTTLKPVAPVEEKTAAPAEEKTATPPTSHEEKKAEPESKAEPAPTPKEEPGVQQKPKESTPVP